MTILCTADYSPYPSLVTQYSAAVRDTLAVKFAINVALSFDSNNFVKFFKLVR